MMTFSAHGIDQLLSDKQLTAAQRRRIIVSSAALNLIATAISTQGTTHKLAEEMQNLSKYVEALDSALGR